MKVTLIVEVPDKRGNGDWYIIGDNLRIVYDDCGSLKNYKYIDDDMVELEPLPQKKEQVPLVIKDENDSLKEVYNYGKIDGYNKCIDELLGE